VRTFVDETLLAFDEVWAAAGTPDSVFPIDSAELVRMRGETRSTSQSGDPSTADPLGSGSFARVVGVGG
jgi:hypothetical protein